MIEVLSNNVYFKETNEKKRKRKIALIIIFKLTVLTV